MGYTTPWHPLLDHQKILVEALKNCQIACEKHEDIKLITRDSTDIKINILHTMKKQIYSFVTWTVGFHKSTTVWVNGDHYIRVIHTFVPK